MIAGLFNSTSLPALEQLAAFTNARHAVLAGNVANLDTPGYRVRDLSTPDFQEKLRTLLQASRRPASGATPQATLTLAPPPGWEANHDFDLRLPPALPPGMSPGGLNADAAGGGGPSSPLASAARGDLSRAAESLRTILFHDDSDVGMEQQIAEITKNQMLHNLAVGIMSSQYRLLQTAISERV